MIEVDKQYTDNPFTDEMIYYCKTIALNSVVKDEDKALENETKESLYNGQLYIACVEGSVKYELFKTIPKEILAKYIKSESNLDLMAKNYNTLASYLNSLGIEKRTIILDNLSKLGQTIYIDHYDIVMNYVLENKTYIEDHKDLYNDSKSNKTTYQDLFEIIPLYTRKRIIKQYISNYGDFTLDYVSLSLSNFLDFVNSIDFAVDISFSDDLDRITKAMRSCFIDHYDTLVERGYYVDDSNNNWYDYNLYEQLYDMCINNTAGYNVTYDCIAADDRYDLLCNILSKYVVDNYNLNLNLNALDFYFNNISANPQQQKSDITKAFTDAYIRNYNVYLNKDIYNKCKVNYYTYYGISEYLPYETKKVILNTEIDEVTNLDIYSENKEMLNSYLASLTAEESQKIKDSIAKDMRDYYINNYEELNNYYRTILGLPPLKDDGVNRYEDTLLRSYDETTGDYIDLGDDFVKRLTELNIYPESHWTKNEICEFDTYDISIINQLGIFDEYKNKCCANKNNTSRYKYFDYLGDNALDVYTCRKADNFQLIGIPTINNVDIKNKFVDTYAVNRDFIIRTVYSDAYKFQSDYYNSFIIVFIMVNTIMDMLSGISEFIINRKVFDYRSIRYLFESYGIPYYSEIPLKYQQAMLKNLNILIKYKSTKRNMIDICKLFGFDDVKVFRYYMLKDRSANIDNGNYLFEENNSIIYDTDNLYIKDKSGDERDINGIRYSKLTDYRGYTEDRFFKSIKCKNDKGEIETTKILKDDIKGIYIKSANVTAIKDNHGNTVEEFDIPRDIFTPIEKSDYYTKIHKVVEDNKLKFVKAPIDDYYTEYKADPNYTIQYREIVDDDNTWYGGLHVETLDKDILDYEFNAVRSKYISIETVTQMTEMVFQVSYFYNMLFDNYYSEDKLTIDIPTLKEGHKFKILDIICYLFSLMYLYNGLEDNIMYSPTQILYVKGYYFSDAVNEILKDPKCFTPFDEKDPDGQENIFDINTRIAEDKYDYIKEFDDKNYKITSFNLSADIDALDKWLNHFQMSLDDFIIERDPETNKAILTLRNFYSLNNSYYQKNIFVNNLLPKAYNQIIKYAFGFELLKKSIEYDVNNQIHEYITELYNDPDIFKDLIIYNKDNHSSNIYVVVRDKFATDYYGSDYTLYNRYRKMNNGDYELDTVLYYWYDAANERYRQLLKGSIFVKRNNEYVLAADKYFSKNAAGLYNQIVDAKYFYTDINGLSIINLSEYYIKNSNGEWVLDPNNCYVLVIHKDGTKEYVLAKDASKYDIAKVGADDLYIFHCEFTKVTNLSSVNINDCFVKTSNKTAYYNAHQNQYYTKASAGATDVYTMDAVSVFIPLKQSDFYIKNNDGTYTYREEMCFVKVTTPDFAHNTYYQAPSNPGEYYQLLSDYYKSGNTINRGVYYVKNSNGDFIPESDLLSPGNCYVINERTGEYILAIDMCLQIKPTSLPEIRNILILQSDYIYKRYKYSLEKLTKNELDHILFCYVLNDSFILSINDTQTYDNTKSMICIMYKEVSIKHKVENEEVSTKYDPENDGRWDENDWFYYQDSSDPNNTIGMNGENKWYINKGGVINDPTTDTITGTGFYLEASSYIGDVKIEPGEKYYIAMDVETNFNNKVHIMCESDPDATSYELRSYKFKSGEKQHIEQVFTANKITEPRIYFLIYNYKDISVLPGSYFIIKNIRICKATNENYISQDILSFDELLKLYQTNTKIYKYLATLLLETNDVREYRIYKTLYDSLMTSSYNKEAFKLSETTYAKTYTDFLRTRDSVLYEKLMYFKALDKDNIQKEIADNIIDVTYALNTVIDTYNYGYLYSYFPAVSASYIQQYILKIIDFFKSWKVHLLGINTVYKFNDPMENTVKILESEDMNVILNDMREEVHINDSVRINPIDAYDNNGTAYVDKDYIDYTESDGVAPLADVHMLYKKLTNDNTEKLSMYPVYFTNKINETVHIRESIKIISRNADSLEYRDDDKDIHLILNNDDIKAHVDKDGNLQVSTGSGLITIENDLWFNDGEAYEDGCNDDVYDPKKIPAYKYRTTMNAGQSISDINRSSKTFNMTEPKEENKNV